MSAYITENTTTHPCCRKPVTPSPFAPGALVRHPTQPEWGVGQVQSVIGNRVTVNFEHGGKQLINAERVDLVVLGEAGEDRPRG